SQFPAFFDAVLTCSLFWGEAVIKTTFELCGQFFLAAVEVCGYFFCASIRVDSHAARSLRYQLLKRCVVCCRAASAPCQSPNMRSTDCWTAGCVGPCAKSSVSPCEQPRWNASC